MVKTDTINNCLKQKLTSSIKENLRKDQELILAHVLNKSRAFILAHGDYKLSKNEQNSFKKLIVRRLKGEPLAYVLGDQEFYGLPFKVNKHVLIPRPETEMMVDLATRNAQRATQKTIIVDIGTGSGALAVSIAKIFKIQNSKFKIPRIFAIDISSKVLAVAKQNAKLNGVDKDIIFFKGNLLEPIIKNSKFKNLFKIQSASWRTKFKIIITANLPYLKTTLPGLTKSQKHDLSFEPRLALMAGTDGLKYYRQLAKQIQTLKKLYPKLAIELLAEIDPDQVKPMRQLFAFSKTFTVKKDFRHLNRLCIIKL